VMLAELSQRTGLAQIVRWLHFANVFVT
jgi:hypothetical protein